MTPGRKAKEALFVLPADWAGGAERILVTAARSLAELPGWSVEIAILAAKSTGFVAANAGKSSVSYGHGVGYFGTEWLLTPRIAKRRFALVVSSHMRINAFLSLMRHVGLLRCDRLVARESTVLADRSNGIRWAAYRALYSLYRTQDVLIAQTGYMAERLRENLPSRLHRRVVVLPNPVDANEIRRAAKIQSNPALDTKLRARPQIGWCGRLIDIKQPSLALDVLSILRGKLKSDVGLVIIGDGPLLETLRADAEQRQLSEYVTFAGHMANPYPILAECYAGLVTSKREGFPNVLLEMIACGIPTIVTTPCAGDLDQLEGVQIIEPDADAIAQTLHTESPSSKARSALIGNLTRRSPERFVQSFLGVTDKPRAQDCDRP